MKLSILIPTLPQRARHLAKLLESLRKQLPEDEPRIEAIRETATLATIMQYSNGVEIITLMDGKQYSVGKKRNMLKGLATGQYMTFVDDDDKVTDDYIETILTAIGSGKDLITYRVQMIEKGQVTRDVHYHPKYTKDMDIRPSTKTLTPEQAASLEGKNKAVVTRFLNKLPTKALRVPNHLMVWRRAITTGIQFPDINIGEDGAWALKMKGRVSNLHEIDKVLYYYMFDWDITETQK